MKSFLFFLLFFSLSAQPAFATFDSADASQQTTLQLTRVTPGGEDVPAGNQVVFQFNRPVVPVGRMERDASEIPVDIIPALKCHWRWINTSALACQLDDENRLTKATRYRVTMRPGIQAEDGSTISENHTHTFITQRPHVRYASFREWLTPGTPVIRLSFDQPVTKASVETRIAYVYPTSVTDETLLVEYLKVEKDPYDENDPHLTPGTKEEARRYWLVTPQKELPLGTRVEMKVIPGLVSALGEERGVEQRMIDYHMTYPEFEFVGFSCVDNEGLEILFTEDSDHDLEKCNPLGWANLEFSAPVLTSQIKQHLRFTPDLAGGRDDYDPWASREDDSYLDRDHYQESNFRIHLPEVLKADQQYSITTETADLQDEFGRKLKAPIDLTFFTDHRKPNFELTHSTAVLEKEADSDVPLYVTNLDSSFFYYDKLTHEGLVEGESIEIRDVDMADDIQFAVPMGIREMLEGKSGAVNGVVSTLPHLERGYEERNLFASVTPYQVHVKVGHFNTLIWVTDLATGKPVEEARVQIYKDSPNGLSPGFEALDKGKTDSSGLVSLKGSQQLDPSLEQFGWCGGDECENFFVRIDKDGEMALMPLDYRFSVDEYRASGHTLWADPSLEYGHMHAWGTTAQGTYRAGDTIQYKLYVRDQDNESFVPAPDKAYTLQIIDPAGVTVEEITDITLSEFGSFSGEYTIPKNAAVGWYDFFLSASFTEIYSWSPLRVLVSDFTPSPFKVVNSLNGDLFHPEDEIEVLSSARLHSGGAYTDAEARITATLRAAHFSSEHPLANGFTFDSFDEELWTTLFEKEGNIGDKGEVSHTFVLPAEEIVYGRLTVESAVRDDRGKYIATSSGADYIAVNRLVGLKQTRWLYNEDEAADIEYLVVDDRGKPAAGIPVTLKIERLQTRSAKVKGAGNAYVTKYIDEWIPSGTCQDMSIFEPLVCSFIPEEAGTYKITATIKDTKGNSHSTETEVWVAGKGRVVWRSPNDNSLQVIPEKTEYQVGDKARYLVKNPYPGAQALVSVERYGVLKSWVQELEGSTPVIEFEIEKDYMPGFYLSVIVVSPRVAAPPPAFGEVDLGKPAFKIGYLEVPVNDPYKQMDISIETDAEVYKPRDIVTAKIHAQPKHRDKNEDIEIAVAVLDEAVLDLIRGGTSYFDPYDGFYTLDSLDMQNYSLLTRLVGRQKFEKKGANPGGDGGADISMRTLFKYVSYWNPSIKADSKGNATIEFEVPDNLTGWRILAIAVTPSDRMGLGDANFKVNRPTEIRPVMPNQVTEGDTFQAGFSVMNRTDKARDITVTIQASGNVKAPEELSKTVHLDPYKRQLVFLPVSSTTVAQSRESSSGSIDFIARASDAVDGDAIEHSVPVYKRRALETAANYGTTTQEIVTESLKFPEKIFPDVGNLSVTLSPTVIGNVDGAFGYMRDYPYTCWEQKLSKGVMASHYMNLKEYLPDEFNWAESEKLPGEILQEAANFQAPNGGMAYFKPQDQYVSPYLSAYTALAFNWLRASNYGIPDAVEKPLHAYLENLLRKDAVPSYYSGGMSSTVRAVALAALVEHGKVSLADLERYFPHVQQMSLFGKSHYLQAALKVEGADEIAKEVTTMILAQSSQSGGKFSFNEELDDGYSRILATPLRGNCGVLSAMTQYGENEAGAELVGDVPFKLLRSITQSRGNRDHWENTQENIFCMNSLIEYSRSYENVKPDMTVVVAMDDKLIGQDAFSDLRDDAATFTHLITADDPGAERTVTISREGDGRLYYATRMSYASLDENAERHNAGIDIRKEYSVERDGKWVLLEGGESNINRGELVRVDIYVSTPTARNFVVVDDPVPGGLEPLNRDLATTSLVDANKGDFEAAGGSWYLQFDDWQHFDTSFWNFYHQELRHDSVRFYSDYLPAGNYHLSYTAQAIAEGDFTRMPVHAEEMYEPDVFGMGLPGKLKVGE
ncbi:large extracellular alpha-helical protein [Solemya velum gill symbiont]|uniref:alpha-2-macroglobulin family protein n=1 Tax=Solemya velum gill symbiont TaxID=2340 RepID=UPI000996B829|nr:alpha-2-macroglobulin family protein [Solemya velum gill symbiont]OOZ75065.1 large extracellular alpha-helical protein [Solemya velum gill symbiont]